MTVELSEDELDFLVGALETEVHEAFRHAWHCRYELNTLLHKLKDLA